jgi:CDP-diacylglycerol--serine O-phosphatidyltransferase
MVNDASSPKPQPDNIRPLPNKRQGLRRGIYLLPNLITTGALFSGFYSIISSMTGDIEQAAIAIVIAGFLDSLDGRVARLTNTQSEFGVQYDSLSDLVAFGVAPALLMFSWVLADLGSSVGLSLFCIWLARLCGSLDLTRPPTVKFSLGWQVQAPQGPSPRWLGFGTIMFSKVLGLSLAYPLRFWPAC